MNYWRVYGNTRRPDEIVEAATRSSAQRKVARQYGLKLHGRLQCVPVGCSVEGCKYAAVVGHTVGAGHGIAPAIFMEELSRIGAFNHGDYRLFLCRDHDDRYHKTLHQRLVDLERTVDYLRERDL